MKNYSSDCVSLTDFQHEVEFGNMISGSNYMWLVSKKDACQLQIKNIKNKNENITSYRFGVNLNEKHTIVCVKDFEFNREHYLLVSLEINSYEKSYLLALYQVSKNRVVCSFDVPKNVTKIEILVKNHHYIENKNNPTMLRCFEVAAFCGCHGGSIYLFDITPHNEFANWNSNEYSPLSVYWHKNIEFTERDENILFEEKRLAFGQSQIFGLNLNYKSTDNLNFYYYENDHITTIIPSSDVKITALKYEKQIDSLMVGFSFGCLQMWNLKNFLIDMSTGYGEEKNPIVGFSLHQPHNDTTRSLYLLVAHNNPYIPKPAPPVRKGLNGNVFNQFNGDNVIKINKNSYEEDKFNSSFVIMYRLEFSSTVHLSLNNNSYNLYEGILETNMVFNHNLTNDTFKSSKASNLMEANKSNDQFKENNHTNDLNSNGLSKVISLQTFYNKFTKTDFSCLIWTLVDRNSSSSSSVKYYLSIFNLTCWIRTMSAKQHSNNEKHLPPILKGNENVFFLEIFVCL